MKVKVSDYITEFFYKNSVNTLFTITGGFAMHLNDSFGKHGNYNIYYQHHEQACGYSANGYSKTNAKPCIVCTTAGCAATNTITPCLIAHQDSLPIIFISGQVKANDTTRVINTKSMKLRHYAGQDCDIISMVTPITKYCKEILSIEEVEEILVEAYKNLINGRPGPIWLSVPIDIQGMFMELDDEYEIPIIQKKLPTYESIKIEHLDKLEELLKKSERPLIIAGNGIKLGNCTDKFNDFIQKYKIPTVVTWHGTDIIETNNYLYCGKIGLLGDRHGNFTLQNCDLLLSLGCRMSHSVVGYNSDMFAREAKIVYIDNDANEIEKQNLKYELKINVDLNTFFDNYNYSVNDYTSWVEKCNHWKNKWIFETPTDLSDENGINPYFALKEFFQHAPKNKISVVASGSIVTIIWHMVNIKKDDKFIISSQGDMGFELTAAIGAQIAEPNKMVIPILGEGSLQLNIQELQTIIHYNLPIKILLFNNNSYGANVITQNLYFKNRYGSDSTSGISFPNTEKIAYAYGIKYLSARKNEEITKVLEEFINCKEAVIFEIFCCVQGRYPKLNSVRNEDGTFTSRPFEDMDPFMDREEFENEMIVKIV
jgi:acetolactate synthase-1/2/3 large subunit